MARRKFSSYRVDVTNIKKGKPNKETGEFNVSMVITGNIEIGIEIDEWTWREDWFREILFKDKASDYEIVKGSLKNTISWDQEKYTETNYVTARVARRDRWLRR